MVPVTVGMIVVMVRIVPVNMGMIVIMDVEMLARARRIQNIFMRMTGAFRVAVLKHRGKNRLLYI